VNAEQGCGDSLPTTDRRGKYCVRAGRRERVAAAAQWMACVCVCVGRGDGDGMPEGRCKMPAAAAAAAEQSGRCGQAGKQASGRVGAWCERVNQHPPRPAGSTAQAVLSERDSPSEGRCAVWRDAAAANAGGWRRPGLWFVDGQAVESSSLLGPVVMRGQWSRSERRCA
jgi:hypothetical protein